MDCELISSCPPEVINEKDNGINILWSICNYAYVKYTQCQLKGLISNWACFKEKYEAFAPMSLVEHRSWTMNNIICNSSGTCFLTTNIFWWTTNAFLFHFSYTLYLVKVLFATFIIKSVSLSKILYWLSNTRFTKKYLQPSSPHRNYNLKSQQTGTNPLLPHTGHINPKSKTFDALFDPMPIHTSGNKEEIFHRTVAILGYQKMKHFPAWRLEWGGGPCSHL